MEYFKIPEELDNKQMFVNKGGYFEINSKRPFLIGGELITIKEAKRFNIYKFLSNRLELTSVNKNQTYFFFGSRRQI